MFYNALSLTLELRVRFFAAATLATEDCSLLLDLEREVLVVIVLFLNVRLQQNVFGLQVGVREFQ